MESSCPSRCAAPGDNPLFRLVVVSLFVLLMSSFESTALSTNTMKNTAGDEAQAEPTTANSKRGGTPAAGAAAALAASAAAGPVDEENNVSTQLDAEESAEIFSEQPTGDLPTAEEMQDRKDATSSAENLLPADKIQNGLRNARMIFATGWASVAATYRDLERTETAERIKQNTVTMMDASMDGLSKVGCKISETAEKGVQVVGAKMEEAAPTLGRWRDEVVIASERGFAAAKDVTGRALAELQRPGGSNAGGGRGGGGGAAGGSASGPDDGPHIV